MRSASLLATAIALALGATGLATIIRPADAGARGATAFCGEQRIFGYIRSLTKHGSSYRMRFDPALFLSGATANQAAAQAGAVPRGQPVPNDNYVVNESPRTYLYIVTATTKVRVLVQGSPLAGGRPVSVRTLYELVRGRHPVKLFERLDTGFWLGVHIDHACSLTQQYHP